MLEEFARCYQSKTGNRFDIKRRHIRCLAHIINLATQALISTRSKAKYYTPNSEDEPLTDFNASERDEVGLVRAIAVKARSSSQRKELFKLVQEHLNEDPRQLLLDMKVRWGSTYVMLKRALLRCKAVDNFVYEVARKETNAEKRRKIDNLTLSEDEWLRVRYFCNLLEHADDAQQAFSSDATPSLHTALPAIEEMYAKWEQASQKGRYKPFTDALVAAMDKLNEYYQRTAESDAHIVAMVLDPTKKFKHFKKNWSVELQQDVEESMKKVFIARFTKLRNEKSTASAPKPKTTKKKRQNIDDTDSEDSSDEEPEADNAQPWLHEWTLYTTTHDIVPENVGIVRWWGLNAHRYPTWASLARDYLAIMGSSVSSERAFSSAGITIGKRRSRLKGDIVEALECLKCLFHHNLLFRDVPSTDDIEAELERNETPCGQEADEVVADADDFSWDQLVVEDDSDDEDL